MIRFACAKCRRTIRVDEKHCGKRGKCPKCGSVVIVPERSIVIEFRCERCRHKIKVPESYAGKKGRGRVFDNIFTERLWRSVKYEEVYLKDYDGVDEARRALGGYFGFYNTDRPHQSLGYRTPAEVHFESRAGKEVLAEA